MAVELCYLKLRGAERRLHFKRVTSTVKASVSVSNFASHPMRMLSVRILFNRTLTLERCSMGNSHFSPTSSLRSVGMIGSFLTSKFSIVSILFRLNATGSAETYQQICYFLLYYLFAIFN